MFTSPLPSHQLQNHQHLQVQHYSNTQHRQIPVFPLDGKCDTQTPRTSHTTSTRARNCRDGNLPQEPTPRSSRPTWQSTTRRQRSDLKPVVPMVVPPMEERLERHTCSSSTRILVGLPVGARCVYSRISLLGCAPADAWNSIGRDHTYKRAGNEHPSWS